jgi:hypothetical protein
MYYNDHRPPHFHARYAEHMADIAIDTLEVLDGNLPRRAMALTLEWTALHRDELRENWSKARQGTFRERRATGLIDMVEVTSAVALEGYKAHLMFSDGTERVVDLEPYLRGLIFEPIKRDISVFKAMFVDEETGTVTWSNGADIAPEVLRGTHVPAWMEEEREETA